MNDKLKTTHNAFCDYEIAKAKNSRTPSVREPKRNPVGIRLSNLSKPMLAREIAALF